MIEAKSLIVGKLVCSVITFHKEGDVFAVHEHTEENTNHITIVASGKCRLLGHPDYEGKIVEAPQIINWKLGKPHGAVALCDGTTWVNILK